MSKKLTTQEFIERAKTIHGDKYDYSKVEYIDAQTKVCIICPTHGEFWQVPSSHLNGIGCKKCGYIKNSSSRTKSVEQFIVDARKVHGDKYDYSKVEYQGNKKKVCIICPKHGEFWQTPDNHINMGNGCPRCANSGIKLSEENFKKRLELIHGKKYDYRMIKYVNMHTKVKLICPIHGEFEMRPYALLHGQSCPQCSHRSTPYTTDEWIVKAKEIHGEKYDYSKVEYKNNSTKVCIICSKHGEFWQSPNHHLKGQGCPNCNNSILENKTKLFLDKNSIEYVQRCGKTFFNWLGRQHLDFYLPKYDMAIECQGIQHFKKVEHFGGFIEFNHRQQLDSKKKRLCEENGVKLYYINYNDDVETKLKEIIQENGTNKIS